MCGAIDAIFTKDLYLLIHLIHLISLLLSLSPFVTLR